MQKLILSIQHTFMSRKGSHEKDFSFYQIIYEFETLNPEMSETEINSGSVVCWLLFNGNILTCFRLHDQTFFHHHMCLLLVMPPNLFSSCIFSSLHICYKLMIRNCGEKWRKCVNDLAKPMLILTEHRSRCFLSPVWWNIFFLTYLWPQFT